MFFYDSLFLFFLTSSALSSTQARATEHASHVHITRMSGTRSLDLEQGISVNVGLMIRDQDSAPVEQVIKRDATILYDGNDLHYRFSDEQEEERVERFKRSEDVWNSKELMKRAVKATITWYTGYDLKNPYCQSQSDWNPTDSSMIGAVTLNWKSAPKCGSFITLTNPKNGKSVMVRVVDKCAGCSGPWVDLTKAAFKKLFPLDVGLAHNLILKKVSAPKKWSTSKYGPKKL